MLVQTHLSLSNEPRLQSDALYYQPQDSHHPTDLMFELKYFTTQDSVTLFHILPQSETEHETSQVKLN